MSKAIFSILNGAVNLVEDGGRFTLKLDASLGGGEASGVVIGQGAIVLDAASALKLGEALLNSHLPVSVQPLAAVVEGIANQAIAALE